MATIVTIHSLSAYEAGTNDSAPHNEEREASRVSEA